MFRALRVRNFRIYASANLVSLTGTWMQRIGQDWLVLQLSDDSGIALGLITALQFGPTLLLSMYGGVLADRYSKRRMLMITQGLMGVLALVLGILVATDGVALWHVFVLAGGLGAVSAIDAPVRQAFVSEMVGPELLGNAVSLNSTIFNGARLVGPSVAGLLIGASSGDTAPAFFVNAASFAFTIGALAWMRAAELRPSPPVARAARPAAGRGGLHVGAPGSRAGDGAGVRHRHVRVQLPGDHRAHGPRAVRPGRRGVRAALDLFRGRLAQRRAALHPAQRPAAAAVPRRSRRSSSGCSPSSPG